MALERRTVEVWADWRGLPSATRIGVLNATPSRGKESFRSSTIEAGWTPDTPEPGSALRLVRGPQYAAAGVRTSACFLDSSPDRWGRVLMQRREAQLAREAKRSERKLFELDYLLGVHDGHRMGALRYRMGDGPFLDDNTELASPPGPRYASSNRPASRWNARRRARSRLRQVLRMLIAPGRSLGGARPKASVIDERGQLWIAKFPSGRDSDDIGGWEGVLHVLCASRGIVTAESTSSTLR